MPNTLVRANSDQRELKVHHGTAYRKLLSDPQTKRRLLDAARSLKLQELPGAKVFSALKKAAIPPSANSDNPAEMIYGSIKATRIGKQPKVQITLNLTTTDYATLTPGTTDQVRADFESLVTDLQNGKF